MANPAESWSGWVLSVPVAALGALGAQGFDAQQDGQVPESTDWKQGHGPPRKYRSHCRPAKQKLDWLQAPRATSTPSFTSLPAAVARLCLPTCRRSRMVCPSTAYPCSKSSRDSAAVLNCVVCGCRVCLYHHSRSQPSDAMWLSSRHFSQVSTPLAPPSR